MRVRTGKGPLCTLHSLVQCFVLSPAWLPRQGQGWERGRQLPDSGVPQGAVTRDFLGARHPDDHVLGPARQQDGHSLLRCPIWRLGCHQTREWPAPGRFGLRLPSSTRCWPLNRQSETQAIKQIPAPPQHTQELYLPVRARCKHNTHPPLVSPAWEAF